MELSDDYKRTHNHLIKKIIINYWLISQLYKVTIFHLWNLSLETYLFGMFITCLIAIINFHVVSYVTVLCQPPPKALRFSHRRGERETRVTGDEPQGTMGRVQTAGEAPARSCVVFLAKKSFSWRGPIFGLFKSWKRSISVAFCCKRSKL